MALLFYNTTTGIISKIITGTPSQLALLQSATAVAGIGLIEVNDNQINWANISSMKVSNNAVTGIINVPTPSST